MSYHQVSPQYLRFLRTFGDHDDVPDLSISGFRGESHIEHLAAESTMPELGRSGKRFQLCYNLRAVAYKSTDRIWSIRAAAFCHQLDLTEGTVLWLVASGDSKNANENLYEKVKLATAPIGCPADRDFSSVQTSLRASLTIHILFAQWALEQWSGYLNWLEGLVRDRVSGFRPFRRSNVSKTDLNVDSSGRRRSPWPNKSTRLQSR